MQCDLALVLVAFAQRWFDVGPPSQTAGQHQATVEATSHFAWRHRYFVENGFPIMLVEIKLNGCRKRIYTVESCTLLLINITKKWWKKAQNEWSIGIVSRFQHSEWILSRHKSESLVCISFGMTCRRFYVHVHNIVKNHHIHLTFEQFEALCIRQRYTHQLAVCEQGKVMYTSRTKWYILKINLRIHRELNDTFSNKNEFRWNIIPRSPKVLG